MLNRDIETTKQMVDYAAGGLTISAMFQWVPSATAILSLLWVSLRIWETETVKGWTNRNQ